MFAIAITILVLELGVPETAVEHPLQSVLDEWPTYVAYVVSFASVGAFWLEHNAITEHLRVTDTVLIRLNLLLLMVVSFLPFPTGLMSEYHGNAGAERVAVTLYGITLLAASTMIAVLWRHAKRERLVHEDLTDQDAQALTKRLNPSLWAYAVLIPAGLALPRVAVFGYLAISVFLIMPFELFRRHRS
ncbi:MAG: TMEM175 family protein [Candidatus Nanopelagicales bacterium]|nr:TMEM175 family protein [Candidatus Nanopelagicales bacterium]